MRRESVVKRLGDVTAIAGVDLDVSRGESFSVLRPSGPGKTTCLRTIGGFERSSAGRVLLAGAGVYHNVIARLRRMQISLEEASMDLGADGSQAFRYVLAPHLSTALVAGGLLAFALSFDEAIVTSFTSGSLNTLPIWILGNLRNMQRVPRSTWWPCS